MTGKRNIIGYLDRWHIPQRNGLFIREGIVVVS